MRKKIKYTDEPLGPLKEVKNFLPPPEVLAARNKVVKVTMNLTVQSLDYYKKLAKRKQVPYQRIIRDLLDHYAEKAA